MKKTTRWLLSAATALWFLGVAAPAYAEEPCTPGQIRHIDDQSYECIQLRDGSTHWIRLA